MVGIFAPETDNARRIRRVELVPAVRITHITGDGKESPLREAEEYWTVDGTQLGSTTPAQRLRNSAGVMKGFALTHTERFLQRDGQVIPESRTEFHEYGHYRQFDHEPTPEEKAAAAQSIFAEMLPQLEARLMEHCSAVESENGTGQWIVAIKFFLR